MDRAGDIYEILEKIPSNENKTYCIIRLGRDRKIKSNDNNKMCEEAKSTKPLGILKFELPSGNISKIYIMKKGPRKKRIVNQEIRVA